MLGCHLSICMLTFPSVHIFNKTFKYEAEGLSPTRAGFELKLPVCERPRVKRTLDHGGPSQGNVDKAGKN